jgi:GT2 family glycosyltransferase
VSAAPGISVITLVRGRGAHLQNLVEGLNRCVAPPDELVSVNMDAAAPPVPKTAFPVRIEQLHAHGLPLAAARNRGAQAAAREHLLFLDVDCIPRSGLIALMDRALAEIDALICAEVLYLSRGAAQPGWTEAALAVHAAPHPARGFPAAGLRREPNPGLFWSLAFGIRRRSFFALGGFDTDFAGYGAEDTDFGFRAQQSGPPLYFLGGTGAYHQHHGVFDPPLQHFADIVRNATIFYQRWNIWPMEDWLHKFAGLGLVQFAPGRLEVIRAPNESEIAAARRDGERF